MMKRLTLEQQAEARHTGIALGFDMFLCGMERDKMMDFWRRFETNRQLVTLLQNRIDISRELQMKPDIEQVYVISSFL